MQSSSGDSARDEVNHLILDLAEYVRDATDAEIKKIREYEARVGFDPDARERVRGRGAGVVWRGRILQGNDTLPPAEAHYVRHVLAVPEWPPGTILDEYLRSIRTTVMDENGGVFLSMYSGRQQVGFVGRSGLWRGPEGQRWILVDFRLDIGHIVTAYQVSAPDTVTNHPRRSAIRWLRRPTE